MREERRKSVGLYIEARPDGRLALAILTAAGDPEATAILERPEIEVLGRIVAGVLMRAVILENATVPSGVRPS